MKMKKEIIIIIAILILGGILRIYGLNHSPPSLNWDEASLGYNAYSIFKTGKDEYGHLLPIYLRSFDDYKSAIPAYLSIPFILIFGLNEIGVRMVSAVCGVISILIIYLITFKLFKSKLAATFSTLFFAISPYSVFFSRGLFEANIALLFFLLGYLFYLYKERNLFTFLSIISLIFSMYIYHSYKILVPLILLALAWEFKKSQMDKKIWMRVGFLIAVLFIPLIIFTLSGQIAARFESTSILKLWPPSVWQSLVNSHDLGFANLLIHNQYFYFLWEVVGRYLGYFSPVNLFIKESQEPGLIIPSLAVLNPLEFIFWATGLILIFRKISAYKSLVFLILIIPIPAILTWNWFQSVRVLPIFALFNIVSGLGLVTIYNYLNFKLRKIFLGVIIILGIWSGAYLFDSLYVLLPMSYASNWQPGFRESMPVIASLADQYDEVIIGSSQGQPYIFTLFYSAYPPEKYLQEVDYQKISQKPRKFYDFGKYKFRSIYWPKDRKLHKILFMGDVYSLPEQDVKNQLNAKIIEDIKDKDGNILVRIVALD